MSKSRREWQQHFLNPGEEYAGIVLGEGGQPDYHLVLLPGEAESIGWKKAKEWAAKIGGELPTRREQALLFANCKPRFKAAWYWSNAQHAANSDCAWNQRFYDGHQYYDTVEYEGRARAVRKITIK